jgi:hypothetical protein
MEFAIRASDRELVFAEDYRDSEESESPFGFHCYYCKTEMMLRSFKLHNKKAPHFAPRHTKSIHIDTCSVLNVKKTGKTDGIDSSIPWPYKNKLVIAASTISKGESKHYASLSICQGEELAHKQYHNRIATHLAPIVRWYLQDPRLRGNSELTVPGCSYREYKSVFQRIYWFPKKNYKRTHVFFGSLLFKNPFEEHEEYIIFRLYQSNNVEPIEVFLHTKGWKDNAKHATKRFVQEAIKKSKDAYKKDENKNILSCIFFLGSVDEKSKRIFHCYDHAAFYAIDVEKDDLKILTEDISDCGICYPSREGSISSEKVFEQIFSAEENETVSSDFLRDRPDEIIIPQNIETQPQFDQATDINISPIENPEEPSEEVDFSEETETKDDVLGRDKIYKVNMPQKSEIKPQSNEHRRLSVESVEKSSKKKSLREQIESSKPFKEGVKLFNISRKYLSDVIKRNT